MAFRPNPHHLDCLALGLREIRPAIGLGVAKRTVSSYIRAVCERELAWENAARFSPQERQALGSRSRIRWRGVLFGVAALAVGGCGTMSEGSKSHSALLASPAVPPPSLALMQQEPVAAAVAAETRVETPPVALPSAQSLASEPVPPPFVP